MAGKGDETYSWQDWVQHPLEFSHFFPGVTWLLGLLEDAGAKAARTTIFDAVVKTLEATPFDVDPDSCALLRIREAAWFIACFGPAPYERAALERLTCILQQQHKILAEVRRLDDENVSGGLLSLQYPPEAWFDAIRREVGDLYVGLAEDYTDDAA